MSSDKIKKSAKNNISGSVQSFSGVQLFVTPMDCSMPGFPVHHQLLELAQTHVHWVSDAFQASHPLSSPSPPAFNLSLHQGLFYESVLCIRWPKYWSFSINPSNEYSGLVFLLSRDSQESSPAPQSESINSSVLGLLYGLNSHIHTWLEKA